MQHYNYQKNLLILWQKAVDLYTKGQRGSETFYNQEELSWLSANGITAQEIYDFAEDFVSDGEPDFTTFALISNIRRFYFINVMNGQPGRGPRDRSTYPAKDAEVDGIRWLPRIMEKARDKLRGELDPNSMYCCAGDRRFLSEHDIHPAEFLQKVAQSGDDDRAIVEWFKKRSPLLKKQHS